MGSPADRYRVEGQRCAELAETAPNRRIARRWRTLADDYIELAERIDAAELPMPGPARWQRQPVQQQQAASTRNGKPRGTP